jgi:hypothetical protein
MMGPARCHCQWQCRWHSAGRLRTLSPRWLEQLLPAAALMSLSQPATGSDSDSDSDVAQLSLRQSAHCSRLRPTRTRTQPGISQL